MTTLQPSTLASLTNEQVYFALDWTLEYFEGRASDRMELWIELWKEWQNRKQTNEKGN